MDLPDLALMALVLRDHLSLDYQHRMLAHTPGRRATSICPLVMDLQVDLTDSESTAALFKVSELHKQMKTFDMFSNDGKQLFHLHIYLLWIEINLFY